MLNDLPGVLTSKSQPATKVFVPRSIRRIKETKKVAFVKRVDWEIPIDRIKEAIKAVGLAVIDVTRLTSKDGNTPIRTIKAIFSDAANRNTYVHRGLSIRHIFYTEKIGILLNHRRFRFA